MDQDGSIESYVHAVSTGLCTASESERQKIENDLTTHLRAQAAAADGNAELALIKLGPATRLAERYRDYIELQRASRSYSPLVTMRAALKSGSLGVLGFLLALLGYWLSGTLLVFGLLAAGWDIVYRSLNKGDSITTPISGVANLFVVGCAILILTILLLRMLLRELVRSRLPIKPTV
jgi:uncharacterized membrane protein